MPNGNYFGVLVEGKVNDPQKHSLYELRASYCSKARLCHSYGEFKVGMRPYQEIKEF